MSNLISSQRYRDDATVQAKREAGDYTVTVFAVEVDGVSYDVIVDGHHSLEAAILDGVEPTIKRADGPLAQEYESEIEISGVEAWLEAHYIDSSYHFARTGKDVW